MPRPQATPVDKVPSKVRQGGRQKGRAQPTQKRGGAATRPLQLEEVRSRGFETTTKATAALVDINKPLTDMQKLFVKHWAAGESISSASFRAGYSDNGTYAYRMVAMPNILALYKAEKAAYEEAAQMSRKKCMDLLIKAYDHAELAGEPASMVSAAREIGKMCGYYEPVKVKVDVNVSGNIVHRRLSSMSDSELLELLTTPSAQTPALGAPE